MPTEWLTSTIELPVWRVLLNVLALMYLGYKLCQLTILNKESNERAEAIQATGKSYMRTAMLTAANDVATREGYKQEHEQAVVDARNEARKDLQAAETLATHKAYSEHHGPLSRLMRAMGFGADDPNDLDGPDVAEARERMNRIRERAHDGDETENTPQWWE